MELIIDLFILIIVGVVGFLFFQIAKVPTAALLGPMFSTGLLSFVGLYPAFTLWPISFVSNIVIGIIIGKQFDRYFFRNLGRKLPYIIFIAAGLIGLSLACGFTFHKLTEISLETSLIATSTGGITEMLIFGMSIDADLPVVACLQIFRIVIFLTLLPLISTLGRVKEQPVGTQEIKKSCYIEYFEKKDYFFMIILAFAGGSAGSYLNIPTGAMLGAMSFAGFFSVMIKKTYRYDTKYRTVAQIGLGIVMGQRMTRSIMTQLNSILMPALATTAVMLIGCVLLAFLLHKISKWDILTCLLCAAPAGITQIATYAEEIGADSFTTSLFHTFRLVSIVTLYPWIVLWAT